MNQNIKRVFQKLSSLSEGVRLQRHQIYKASRALPKSKTLHLSETLSKILLPENQLDESSNWPQKSVETGKIFEVKRDREFDGLSDYLTATNHELSEKDIDG